MIKRNRLFKILALAVLIGANVAVLAGPIRAQEWWNGQCAVIVSEQKCACIRIVSQINCRYDSECYQHFPEECSF